MNCTACNKLMSKEEKEFGDMFCKICYSSYLDCCNEIFPEKDRKDNQGENYGEEI